MYNSHNSIVQTCFMNALYNSNSVIGLKIAYFRAKYCVNFITSTRSTIMSSIHVTVPTEDQTVPHRGDLTPCLSRKFARLGILVCDLYLTYHTEHILIFLAHYCNNCTSVSNSMVTNQNRLSAYLGFLLSFHKSQSYTLCNYT